MGMRLLAGLAMVPEGLAVPLAASLDAVWAVGLILAIEPAANVLAWPCSSGWCAIRRSASG